MKKLNNIPIFKFILLVIHLFAIGCDNISDKNEVIFDTNKIQKIVLKEESFSKKTNILNLNLNFQNEKLIHEAAADGDISAVTKYLDSGIKLSSDYDINKTYGGNPLFSAVFNGHNEIVKLLISSGSDINSTDINGETPLDWAISRNHIETDLLLRKHGGKTSKELKTISDP